eukprot:scaffold899_cov80-Cylindrotheca_fusiformis.AAC.3
MVEQINLKPKGGSSHTSLLPEGGQDDTGSSSSSIVTTPVLQSRKRPSAYSSQLNDNAELSPSSLPESPMKKLTLSSLTVPDIMDSPNNKTIAVDIPRQRQSQFWSLQDETKTPLLSLKQRVSITVPALKGGVEEATPSVFPEPKISPTPAANNCNRSNNDITTKQTLDGAGPKVRLTRAAMLKLKSRPLQQQEPAAQSKLKSRPGPSAQANIPNTTTTTSQQTRRRTSSKRSYPRPWLTSPSNPKKPPVHTNTSTKDNGGGPTPKTPTIRKLPVKTRRVKPQVHPPPGTTVRLTRSAMLKLKQSQQQQNATQTLQDWDNQRLGIPPIKYLEIPNSPTKIDFDDDDMEHPNDIARQKLQLQQQQFGVRTTRNV